MQWTVQPERFNPQVHEIMRVADAAARGAVIDFTGTEHVLLGLVADAQVQDIFHRCGVDGSRIYQDIQGLSQQLPDGQFTTIPRPLTPALYRWIAFAITELTAAANQVTPLHFLLAAFRDNATAWALLSQAGLKLPDLITVIRDHYNQRGEYELDTNGERSG